MDKVEHANQLDTAPIMLRQNDLVHLYRNLYSVGQLFREKSYIFIFFPFVIFSLSL